jgi:hemophore-related protein
MVRLVVVVCTQALVWAVGAGVASAEPDLAPFLNTTCTYSQAEAALNALSPDGGVDFHASPMRQTWLHAFLDSPVEQRRQLIREAPDLNQYTPVLIAMANTCSNYPAG